MSNLHLIPKANAPGKFHWVSVDDRRSRQIPGKLPDHSIWASASWFCIPEHDTDPVVLGGKTYTRMAAYCGAPAGIRCRCGAQAVGHDPGDEDGKAP